MTLPLFGKRVERTEWGVRWLRDSPALTSKRGHITQAPNENQARQWATHPEAQYWGIPGGVRGSRGPHRRHLHQLVGARGLRVSRARQCAAQQHDSREMT